MYSSSKILPLTLCSVLALTLAGCESSGGMRMASVGSSSIEDTGSGSDDSGSGSIDTGNGSGTGSDTGSSGTGGNGTDTADNGQGDGSGGSQGGLARSRLRVGGIVGPNGVGGTGLLANTGDPSSSTAASPILVSAGNAVLGVAGRSGTVVPANTPISGTVEQVLRDTGQALVRAGDGSGYLVDGLTAAPGSAVTFNVGNSSLVGTPGSNPLIGASVLSDGQTTGSLATVGVSSGGNLATLAGPAGTGGSLGSTTSALTSAANGALGNVTGATGATGTLANVTAGNTQVLGGSGPAAIGVGVLSPTQPSGTVASVGVASGGNLLGVNVAPLTAGGSANGSVNGNTGLLGAVGATGATSANGTGSLLGSVGLPTGR